MLPRATLSNVAVPQGRRPTQAFLKLLKKAEQRFLRARLRIGIIYSSFQSRARRKRARRSCVSQADLADLKSMEALG